MWSRARPPISLLLLLRHRPALVAHHAGRDLARMEIRLAHGQLQLAQQIAALRLEISRIFGYPSGVGLLEHRLEPYQQAPGPRAPAWPVDPRHRLQRHSGREPRGARKARVEKQAFDHVLRRDATRVTSLVRL